MIRVKFGFHESSYDTLLLLAKEQGVSTAEIVRRSLSLYNSVIRVEGDVIVTQQHLKRLANVN